MQLSSTSHLIQLVYTRIMRGQFSILILSVIISFLFSTLILLSFKQNEDKIDTYQEFLQEHTNSSSISKYTNEIDTLFVAGMYNEALTRHIWFHNHILEYDSAWAGVRLSFALHDWKKLSNKYKPAKDSLNKIRDIKTERIIQEGSSKEDFAEV